MGRERRELRVRRNWDETGCVDPDPPPSIPQLCVRQPALVHARRTVEKKQTTSSLKVEGLAVYLDRNLGWLLSGARE